SRMRSEEDEPRQSRRVRRRAHQQRSDAVRNRAERQIGIRVTELRKCGRDIEKRPIFHAGFYFAEAAIARSADAAIVEHENRRTARPEIAREMLVVARRNSSAADDQ